MRTIVLKNPTVSDLTYLAANLAAKAETPGTRDHGCPLLLSGTGLSATGSSYRAPWQIEPTPWNCSLFYEGEAVKEIDSIHPK